VSTDALRAEERLLKAALRVLLAERGLTDLDGNILVVRDTCTAMRIAAKDLADAVDALPEGEQPRGWGT
jgi:hypothetical protein